MPAIKFNWEMFDNGLHCDELSYRAKVKNGWIVKNVDCDYRCSNICFIPDPNHEIEIWDEVEAENEQEAHEKAYELIGHRTYQHDIEVTKIDE